MTATKRLDKKCGASGIPDTAKCTKGSGLRGAAKAAAAAGVVAGGALALRSGSARKLASFATRNRSGRRLKMSGQYLNNMKPMSKTQRLAKQAQTANKAAEQAFKKAREAEISRATAVGEAMYKAGKASRASLNSGLRRHRLTVEKARRKYEPGYRKPRRDLGSLYKGANKKTGYVRDRLAKIMDGYRKKNGF